MKIVFVIQGEGRGHLSQALALAEMLPAYGHSLHGVFVGECEDRQIPEYVRSTFGTKLKTYRSPNLVKDSTATGVSYLRSVRYNVRRRKSFTECVRFLHEEVRSLEPDVVVNFYEPLWGLQELYFGGSTWPSVSIGHQYLLDHPAIGIPRIRRAPITAMNALTSAGSTATIALSYRPYARHGSTIVCPPLIRREILNTKTTNDGHLTVYLLNHGYAEELLAWHAHNPEVKLECFWDRPTPPEGLAPRANVLIKGLDQNGFIRSLASSAGVLTTSGFESICEAMVLGKPVQVVPVKGHREQALNAEDAELAGAIYRGLTFHPGRELLHSKNWAPKDAAWLSAGHRVVTTLEEIVSRRSAREIRRPLQKATQLWLD